MVRTVSFVIVLLLTAAPTVRAVYYYENTQFRYSANQSWPHYDYAYPSANSNSVCLYLSASGECMVWQYIDTSHVNRSRYRYPVYNRDYLEYERRYADRDDDDDYYYYEDDDYYSTDDDEFYDDDEYEDIDDDDWEDIKDDFFDDDDF